MELKKQKLLMMLHVPDTGHEMQPLAIDPSTEGEGKVEEEDEEELRDDLVGMKCSAPLKEVSQSIMWTISTMDSPLHC